MTQGQVGFDFLLQVNTCPLITCFTTGRSISYKAAYKILAVRTA